MILPVSKMGCILGLHNLEYNSNAALFPIVLMPEALQKLAWTDAFCLEWDKEW